MCVTNGLVLMEEPSRTATLLSRMVVFEVTA